MSKTLTLTERGESPRDAVSGAPIPLEDDPLYCAECSIRTTSEKNMIQHKLGRRHKINDFRSGYIQGRKCHRIIHKHSNLKKVKK